MSIRIFISSVQSEFAKERAQISDYIRNDAMLSRYFQVCKFEDTPAINATAPAVYLKEAAECDIYLGLIGEKYGYEDKTGVSPTEREYDQATKHHRCRLIFVKDCEKRHPKEEAFLAKVEKEVVRRSYDKYEELQRSVYEALVRYMQDSDILRGGRFDERLHETATLKDIDREAVRYFIRNAVEKRSFPLTENASVRDVLTHLNLMSGSGKIRNAALLLFAKAPQRFFLTSEVKCAQFYGTEIEKPIPYYQVYQGNVFELIEQAVTFVMSHIDARVGTREKSTSVDVDYELPVFAVREAIVNAIAHRDYTSNGSVQVMLFRDRLEIWNPGCLPEGITIARLSKPHHSIPPNPLLATPIYLAGYIERMGTGTGEIIKTCKEMRLRTPEFSQHENFRVVIWRTSRAANKAALPRPTGITPRQRGILNEIRKDAGISMTQLAHRLNVSFRTIARDITFLNEKGYLDHVGPKRKGKWIITLPEKENCPKKLA